MVAFTICCYVTGSDVMKPKLLSVLTVLAFIMTSCSSTVLPRLEVSSYMEKTIETDTPFKIDIDCENGNTEVYSWNRKEARLEFTEIVRGNELKSELLKRLDDFNIAIDSKEGTLTLKSGFRGGSRKSGGLLNLKLYIPKKTSSFSIVQKSGSLTFLDDFNGDIDVNAENLDLNINRMEGKLKCLLEKGNLRVSSGELESDSNAMTSKGNIRIKATFESSGAYSFKTGFGILELCLPVSTNAVFDTYGLLETVDFTAGENPSRFRLESRVGKISVLKF